MNTNSSSFAKNVVWIGSGDIDENVAWGGDIDENVAWGGGGDVDENVAWGGDVDQVSVRG